MADDKGSAVSEHLVSGSEGSNNLVIVVDTNSDQPAESLDKAFPKNGPIPTIAPLPDHGTLGLGTDFRSMEDLATRNRRFFQLISSKKYRKVEDFLADRGHEVGIVPKVGCSALHYTKFNVANWESSDTRDSPLILASKIDCQMVNIILKFGGNPNHTNFDGDSPLSIAASRGDQETIDTLLLAGANLTAAIIKLTSSLRFKSQGFDHESETGFSIKSLNLLVNDEVFLKCREPIRTAFDVRRNIELILEFRDEFKIDFEYLIRDCEQFAYRLLNQCDKMWEARQVLDRAHGLLRKAIDERNKQFVSHPFSQQIIQEEWRGELTYKNTCCDQITIWMWYLASPIVLPFFLLKYIIFDKPRKGKENLLTSACGRHMKLLFTPYVCFVTDMVNYFILLGLLILVCILPQTSSTPGIEELILWACALSRLLIELDQVFQQGIYRYATFWNFVDVLTALLMTIAAIFRISLWINAPTGRLLSGEEKLNLRDYIMINTYLYAFAEFFLIIRWLNLLEVTTDLGPLLIAMKYMVADVLKFVFLLLATCVLGAFVSIYSITTNIQELEKTLIDNQSISNVTIPDVFNAP